MTRLALDHPSAANVHLDAVEHKDTIVFLHRLEEGPASQSYGLQVAQLAGVPRTVIQLARRRLTELEQKAIDNNCQGDLFVNSSPSLAVDQHAVLGALEEINPDQLGPREALDVLYRLKQLAQSDAINN